MNSVLENEINIGDTQIQTMHKVICGITFKLSKYRVFKSYLLKNAFEKTAMPL